MVFAGNSFTLGVTRGRSSYAADHIGDLSVAARCHGNHVMKRTPGVSRMVNPKPGAIYFD